ncbi:peptide-methionine (S)-S-oxide reductase MsrA [Halorhodospira halochloris]|uniref:peptide-methionine (S)-S-oxide reductase MsrA n=1 Tax=Halorhodospira halochloris TaxID=1052 RepID=UPI001EE8B211|nr:peptide-methionine (S)-S-oxide reductase MsrA [Halorhodospira halochloris]MCG5549429.1 peptide-methionine (S)-S-oxide reductase MsrA [Halorhodospira halochloris]
MSRSITVGGGCFWCIEGVFQQLPAVHQAISGYAGGESPDPSYREVCSGRTGHAEVVQVNFDPEQVEERALLELFFAIHDPTQHNRQGPDVGSQYRSIILYADKEQRQTAEAVIKEIEAAGEYSAPIVTELVPLTTFYPAEEVHQRYYEAAPEAPYCRSMIAPKIAKARERFPRLFDGWAN